MTREQREQAARTLQEFYDFNKTLTPQGDSWLQADITINRYTQEELGKALPTAIAALRDYKPKPAQHEQVSPTTQHCPVCASPLECRGGYIRVIIGTRDMTSGIQGASWYCAECDRVWDYGDLPSIARQLEDACDRLRWLLTQAERVVRVDNEDRAAVDRACRLMTDIDNGFDRERG